MCSSGIARVQAGGADNLEETSSVCVGEGCESERKRELAMEREREEEEEVQHLHTREGGHESPRDLEHGKSKATSPFLFIVFATSLFVYHEKSNFDSN